MRAWVVASLLVVLALAAAFKIYSNRDPLHEFWKPVLSTSPVLVIVETWVGATRHATSPPSGAVQELMDPKSFLILNEINSKMAAYFSTNRMAVDYELARNITLPQLRTRPFVLRAGFNNPTLRRNCRT